MDREEAIKILENERNADVFVFVSDYRNRINEALDLAIEALSASEDCISRKQAVEEMSEATIVLVYDYDMEQDELVDTIEEQVRGCAQQILKSLPSVTPTERME